MKLLILTFGLATVLTLLSACTTIDQGAVVSAPTRNGEVLVLGEIHGTAEIPNLTLTLLERAARHGKVIFGVELAPDSAALSCSSRTMSVPDSWRRPKADGRTSVAMHALLCGARKLLAAGSLQIVYLDDRSAGVSFDENAAARFTGALARSPGATAIVLTGNFHARQSGRSLAMNLRNAGLKVVAATASTADPMARSWQCQGGKCGEQIVAVDFCRTTVSIRHPIWTLSKDPRWMQCLVLPGLSASPPYAVD